MPRYALFSFLTLVASSTVFAQQQWTTIPTNSEDFGILPRANFGTASVNSKVGYLFGGAIDIFGGDNQALNDFYSFQVDKHGQGKFTDIQAPNPPSPRQFPGMAANEHYVAICGGGIFGPFFTFDVNDDVCYLYDIEDNTWILIGDGDDGPEPRSGASVVASGKYFYVFGGIKPDPSKPFSVGTLSDLWRFDTEEMTWKFLGEGAVPSLEWPKTTNSSFTAEKLKLLASLAK